MVNRKPPRHVMLKEELIYVAQGLCAGVVLDRILFVDRQTQFELEDNPRGLASATLDMIRERWQVIKPEELAPKLLIVATGKSVRNALNDLVRLGLIEEQRSSNGPSRFRPNIETIQDRLEEVGWVLNDYPRSPHRKPKPKPQAPTDSGALWDEIPRADTKTLTKEEETDLDKGRRWIMGEDKLKNFPPPLQRVAYLVFRETGFTPVGGVADYRKQCQDLWSSADYKEDTLVAGLQAGETARREKGFTFSGPRSYNSYIRNATALAKQAKQPIVVGGEKKKSNRPIIVN